MPPVSTSHLQNTVHKVSEEEDDQEGSGASGDDLDDESDAVVEEAVRVVEKWNSPAAEGRLVFESPKDSEEYLAAATCLVGTAGARVEVALQGAMYRLEEEFGKLLTRGSVSLSPEDLHASLLPQLSPTVSTFSSTSSVDNSNEGDESAVWGTWSSVFDSEILDIPVVMHILPYRISPHTISILKDIADVLLRVGHSSKLCQVYVKARRDTLMGCLAVLEVDKKSLEEVQGIEWDILNNKMKKWIQALKVVVHGLLAEERRICSQIFAADAHSEEECFTEVAKGCVLQLLRFADNIAIWKPSSEKLFCILEMYEALAELLPELLAWFSVKVRGFIKEEAELTLVNLGDAVRGTVAEFANTISRETSCGSIPGGGIHLMTRCVMNYVVEAANYSRWLNHLLAGCETQVENQDTTPFGYCVLILITRLVDKIEDTSKLYADEALQNIFLMDNLLYIVQKVKSSELRTWLGDNWIHARYGLIRAYSKRYLQSSWTRVIACLRDDGLLLTTGSSSTLKGALKERFKSFNLAYEELYRTQTTWMVADPQLREELKISISEQLIPTYRSFVERYRGQLQGLRGLAKYVKYSPEDLENQIVDIFAG
uniref:Uncharacterized protein n=1 Tax=Avena sativa TaxID=4498 RepID=A0ACD5W4U1_AVESA